MTSFLHSLALLKPKISVVTSLVLVLVMTSLFHLVAGAVDPLKVDGKKLFQSLMASRCSVKCNSNRIKPVCGTDDVTYANRCELKRAKKCDGLRIKVKHKGRCAGDISAGSSCERQRQEAQESIWRGDAEVQIPTCKPDGSFNEIQCHAQSGYCWCVNKDGRHKSGTSVKGQRPRCKGRRRGRKRKKSKKRKTCSSKDRQTFNSALIKVFEEEYLRVHPTRPPVKENQPDDFGTEKAIVLWKFEELDINKDGHLKFKEVRNFGRMVKKLIQPRACAKRFIRYCDSRRKDNIVEKDEWTLCLGVDIKLSFRMFISLNSAGEDAHTAGPLSLDRLTTEILRNQFNHSVARPFPKSGVNPLSHTRPDSKDKKVMNCLEAKAEAMTQHSQEPDANHYIPKCSLNGLWEKAQCHKAMGICWCVKESTGVPIHGTTMHFKATPNCSFDNDREMKGCPFEEKRKFLVDLVGDLTKERQKAMSAINNDNSGAETDLSLRETVARWKLKALDTNNNGVLDRKEWKPLRRTTLKNRKYPRKCRRNFVKYCDEDNDKRITWIEWRDCLGLNEINLNGLPINPMRQGKKNPFDLLEMLEKD